MHKYFFIFFLFSCTDPSKEKTEYTMRASEIKGDMYSYYLIAQKQSGNIIDTIDRVEFKAVYENAYYDIMKNLDKSHQNWSCKIEHILDTFRTDEKLFPKYEKIVERFIQKIIDVEKLKVEDSKKICMLISKLTDEIILSSYSDKWTMVMDSFYKNVVYSNYKFNKEEWYKGIYDCEREFYTKWENVLRKNPQNSDSIFYLSSYNSYFGCCRMNEINGYLHIYYKLELQNRKGKTKVKLSSMNYFLRHQILADFANMM